MWGMLCMPFDRRVSLVFLLGMHSIPYRARYAEHTLSGLVKWVGYAVHTISLLARIVRQFRDIVSRDSVAAT